MKIQVFGKNYKVGFSYVLDKRMTVAYIEDLDDHVLFESVAVLSKKDQFNKKIGRKVALARVLKSYFSGYDNKPFRTELWTKLQERGMRVVV
jgi:hypothetical protein